ncbi:MAG: amidase, partial [Acidimicrobiia bacterium]|nr:amidase [Acidimicrobiia bacterium]
MYTSEYLQHDAVGLADLVRARQLKAVEIIDAAVRQIEALNPLNAVIHKTYDRARRAAADATEGPLAGVPMLIKDLGQTVAGSPVTLGSRMLAHQIADHDSNLVARYRAAGMAILGQTNVPEFGLAATTEPELFGPTRNPWNLERSAGGSSGGAAAAVAGRMVPTAHASDGGGSIRIPASMCGLFGLKPTRARTPKGPDVGEGWFGLSVDHALTVSVRDSAVLLDVTQGPDPGAPYFPPSPARLYADEVDTAPGLLRVAVSNAPMLGHSMDPACISAVQNVAELLTELGHEVTEATPAVDAGEMGFHFGVLSAAAAALGVTKASALAGRDPDPKMFEIGTWVTAVAGRRLSAEDLAAAIDFARQLGRQTAPFWDTYDILVEPTLARPPWRLGEMTLSESERRTIEVIRRLPSRTVIRRVLQRLGVKTLESIPNTPLWNVTGQPSMSVPLHWHEGLPIGVQFTARYADEATLFRLAAQLEAARPWRHMIPPLVDEGT